MTVAANDRRVKTTTSGSSNGPFSFDFATDNGNELDVQIERTDTGAVVAYTFGAGDFTVALNADQEASPGGTLTFTPGAGLFVPAGILTILGLEVYSQTFKAAASTDEDVDGFNASLDTMEKQIQQLTELAGRAMKFRKASSLKDKDFPDYAAAQSGQFLSINSSGELVLVNSITGVSITLTTIGQNIGTAADAAAVLALLSISGLEATTAFMKTVLSAADAAAALATLEAIAKDGSVAYTGDQSMGNKLLTNIGANGFTLGDPFQHILFKDDFIVASVDAVDLILVSEHGWMGKVTGAGATVNVKKGTATNPGIVAPATGTTTTGEAGISTENESLILGSGTYTIEWLVSIPILSTVGEEFKFHCGLNSTSGNSPPDDGVYFLYDRLTSVNWRFGVSQGGTRSESSSSVAVGTGFARLKAVVNAAASSVEFFIDGVSVGTQTTNIPTVAIAPEAKILKSAGTTNREAQIDLAVLEINLTAAR